MRRSGRIPKEIPIILIGSDLAGKIFSEQTKTVLLSLHGAGLLSQHKLSPEQEMVLRWPERNKEEEIRVVGQIGEDSGVYTYGVAFFDHVENFWEMEFPPPTLKEQELGVLTLVCNVCQTFERLDDHSIEADVVATNDGVLRYCKRCGNSTILESWSARCSPSRCSQCGRVSCPSVSITDACADGSATTCSVTPRVCIGIRTCRPGAFSSRASTGARRRVRLLSNDSNRSGRWAADSCDADFRYFSIAARQTLHSRTGFFEVANDLSPDFACDRKIRGKNTVTPNVRAKI